MPQRLPVNQRSDVFQRYEVLRRNREKRTHCGQRDLRPEPRLEGGL